MSNEVCFKVPNVPGHEFLMMKPDDLAALVRDAKRYRRMEACYYDGLSGRPAHGSIQLERWDAEWMDWVPLSDRPLAEIADALPEVEQK